MKVTVQQLFSNIEQRYNVVVDSEFYAQGLNGRFSEMENIRLFTDDEILLTGKKTILPYQLFLFIMRLISAVGFIAGYKEFILLLFVMIVLTWIGKSHLFSVFENKIKIASFICIKNGPYSVKYDISSDIYDVSVYQFFKDTTVYLSIYKEDMQIGLIEVDTERVVDYKYDYRLYLLDTYSSMKDILIMFILYYANINNTKRFHMTQGTVFKASYWESLQYNKYKEKYNEDWKNLYFSE